MTKMRYFNNKFLTFDFGDLKLGDFPKLRFFKLIITKSNLKNICLDVIPVTSLLLRHRKTSLN